MIDFQEHNEDTSVDYPWIYPESSDAERIRRWNSIRTLMREQSIDCLLIPGNNVNLLYGAMNVLYVSNYVIHFGYSYVVFPLEGEPFLSVGYETGPQRIKLAKHHSWIKKISGDLDQDRKVAEYIRELGLGKGKVGIVDPMMLPAPFFDRLRGGLPEVKFEDTTKIIRSLRATLSSEEVSMLEKAARLCDLSFDAAVEVARPGVREYEVWGAIIKAIVGNGGFYPHFCLITSARRPVFPRSPPSHRMLEKGDTILVEVNGTWSGYSAQIAYAISLGFPDNELTNMFNLCLELYDQASIGLNEGKTYLEVNEALHKRIAEAGYVPMTPQVHLYLAEDSEKPLPGHNFIIHPCVASKDYSIGMKFGDYAMIDNGGKVRSLAKTPHEFKMIE